MPGKKDRDRGELPRTDLPPRKIPYDDDYFGSNEEEGVERERQASDEDEAPGPGPGPGPKAA